MTIYSPEIRPGEEQRQAIALRALMLMICAPEHEQYVDIGSVKYDLSSFRAQRDRFIGFILSAYDVRDDDWSRRQFDKELMGWCALMLDNLPHRYPYSYFHFMREMLKP